MSNHRLKSSLTSPSDRCYDRGDGRLGCFTTGWQDHVEVEGKIYLRTGHRDQHLEGRIRTLFRRHARSIPSFLVEGSHHRTKEPDENLPLLEPALELYTVCTGQSTAPWGPSRRSTSSSRRQCNLFTLLRGV